MTANNVAAPLVTADQIDAVCPALAVHTRERLIGNVWERPGLDHRDRCLITIAAFIASGDVDGLGHYGSRALDNGVTAAELSELVLHLAYYAGWGRAMAATAPLSAVFAERAIVSDQLASAGFAPLPLDEAAEAGRAQTVGGLFGTVAPGLVDYTTDYLFRDLWLRPGLAPRDRSLITVAALVASGQAQQVTFHLNRAMDNGLTRDQAAEVITHLAFYAGWPKAMTALPVFKDVFAARAA